MNEKQNNMQINKGSRLCCESDEGPEMWDEMPDQGNSQGLELY